MNWQPRIEKVYENGALVSATIQRTPNGPKEPYINEALAQPEQEPYGYLKLNTGKFVNEVEGLNPMTDKRYLPLYTTPPQRKPLTQEQRDEIARQADANDWHDYDLIDAVEAAHGIKGEA